MTIDEFKKQYPLTYECRLIVALMQSFDLTYIAVQTLICKTEYGKYLAKKAYSKMIKRQSKIIDDYYLERKEEELQG